MRAAASAAGRSRPRTRSTETSSRRASAASYRAPAADAAARAGTTLEELGARAPEARVGGLSARETEVLRLVARGLGNDDIARELVLSVRTVERHVANVYLKIGASGRTARAVATGWAHAHGVT